MRKEELDLLIKDIQDAATKHAPVDLSAKVSSLSAAMSCRMVFGKKYTGKDIDERSFKAVIKEVMHLSADPNLGDYIPQIAGLDLQGLMKRMKAIAKVFDVFFEKIVDKHVQLKEDKDRNKDFVMLGFMESEETEYRISREHIKAIMLAQWTL
ncbi:hypothetical protein GH714_019229 [Hevea brasiliensis]|uniref:Uncharacterized protein n=1 Tax=Hevea brasiliensis TaxID=3981 RepID=A0A6A6K5V6_HEVBR|nr:hypothetical protein GH714_019229 [Hevea brasiliensis]